MSPSTKAILPLILLLASLAESFATTTAPAILERIKAPEANQGVAIDAGHIYAIDSRAIGKYERATGRLVKRWQESADGLIIHLDSGVIVDGKLYCAHSNYPRLPMASSVEIWDAATLEHIGTHSFGHQWGSCTWIDYHQNHWWAAFAHYDQFKEKTGTDAAHTTLVKFDRHWRPLESWAYPQALIARMRPMSNSGGSWGPDNLLYLTGHDAAELYVISLPQRGPTLEWLTTIPAPIQGQGIAWDRTQKNVMVGIRRSTKEVITFTTGGK